jgi:hypothetical protein
MLDLLLAVLVGTVVTSYVAALSLTIADVLRAHRRS